MAIPAQARERFRDLLSTALARNYVTTERFTLGGQRWKFLCTPTDDGYVIRLERRED